MTPAPMEGFAATAVELVAALPPRDRDRLRALGPRVAARRIADDAVRVDPNRWSAKDYGHLVDAIADMLRGDVHLAASRGAVVLHDDGVRPTATTPEPLRLYGTKENPVHDHHDRLAAAAVRVGGALLGRALRLDRPAEHLAASRVAAALSGERFHGATFQMTDDASVSPNAHAVLGLTEAILQAMEPLGAHRATEAARRAAVRAARELLADTPITDSDVEAIVRATFVSPPVAQGGHGVHASLAVAVEATARRHGLDPFDADDRRTALGIVGRERPELTGAKFARDGGARLHASRGPWGTLMDEQLVPLSIDSSDENRARHRAALDRMARRHPVVSGSRFATEDL